MKLYEFVDKLYAMGDMESPKTVRSKKTLNESYTVSDELFDKYKLDDSKDVGDIYNEITFNYGDEDLADDVVSRIEVYRNNRDDDYYDDDLDEGILGGLAGAAIGGLAGNSLGHPVLGAIGGGLAGSAIQNALNDDLDEELQEEGLNEDKDLSTVSGSMTQILQDNREKIDACGSAQEVHDVVAGLLAEAGLDTQATRRLLLTLKKQKGLTGALQAVYNSILKGSDLGVLKEAANTNPPRYQIKGCSKNGRVENHDQFMIFDSEYNDEIDYYDLCEIIRDVNEDEDLSSSQVEDIATDVISELYFQTPDEDLGEIISMYSY